MIGDLTNHLWQSTLFAVAAGLLALALRNNRAHVRYALWLSASFKFLIPFSLLIGLGSRLGWTGMWSRAVSSAIIQISQPFTKTLPRWAFLATLSIWSCGFVVVVLTRVRGWLRIRAALRASTPSEIAATFQVRSAPGLLEPGVVGLTSPILLLPDGIVERLLPCQLDAVLAHERCHIRRRDNLLAAIHMIVEAVFWFLPRVWWIGARLVEERERACDEAVLRLGVDPRDYAEAILNVCKLYVESPLACVSGVTGPSVKKRIQAILTGRVAAELSLAKKAALTIVGIAALMWPIAVGTAQSQTPKFEVASIRRCGSGSAGKQQKGRGGPGAASVSPGRLNTGCSILASADNIPGLIQRVYGRLGIGHVVAPRLALPISGGPAWVYSDAYNINAVAEGNASEQTMEGPMLQELLEDRFTLKLHRETRDVPVYALTVAKSGSKLKPFKEGSCATPPDLSKGLPPPLAPGEHFCNYMIGGRKGPNTMVNSEGGTLDEFSRLLGLVLGRPVMNKTAIAGKFDIHLEFAADETTPGVVPAFGPASDEPPAASIFTVMQEQLGLKLEPGKGPRDFLVIDHIERPSAN